MSGDFEMIRQMAGELLFDPLGPMIPIEPALRELGTYRPTVWMRDVAVKLTAGDTTNPASDKCPYCGNTGRSENLRGGWECAGCGHPT